MARYIDMYNEGLANNKTFNKAVIFGAILLQGICTVALITASYFNGMRKGVDITDDYYERNRSDGREEKERK